MAACGVAPTVNGGGLALPVGSPAEDERAVRGRPKACDPGAAARAMDGWMMLSPHKGGGKIRKSA